MSRRLPVYLLIDSSGSMAGEPIHSVNVGLRAMVSALRQDPFALESVSLAITTFDVKVTDILPMTPVAEVQIVDIEIPKSGATHLGAGLEHIIAAVKRDVVQSTGEEKGDFRPMLFIMTDGSPSDTLAFKEAIPVLKTLNFAEIIACAAGPKAKTEALKQITDNVVKLDNMDSTAFSTFFKWVSDSISAGSTSSGIEGDLSDKLPAPPAEITFV